ncbi:MAG: hypothetical protein K2X03_21615 [Bryobacteraceae bacterium]|nr:hypothetical protein [Bryobacteraceae bacterium]
MQHLTQFFRDAPTSMGVFYPMTFAIISFRSYSAAQDATQALLQDGFDHDSVRFISARELLEYLGEIRSTATGMIMSAISRLTDTEGANALRDEQRAKAGAGFVAVHCPTESEALRAQEIVGPWRPQAMDYYIRGGIESLVSSAVPAELT